VYSWTFFKEILNISHTTPYEKPGVSGKERKRKEKENTMHEMRTCQTLLSKGKI
jgi:hypothetical protein